MAQNPLSAFVAQLTGTTTMKPLVVDANGNLQVGPSAPAGSSVYNLAALSAGHQIKTGAGTLSTVNINTAGTSSNVITLYDGTSTSGTKLATIDGDTLFSHVYNLAFTTGLFIVSATGTAADVTVGYY